MWRRASDGSGFCEVARLFFGKFVERYLNYFIGREASSHLANTEDRERLARRLGDHVDGVSHHAFETARITQSFAAGWFNRYARDGMPAANEISGFLSHSVGKLREELLREEAPQERPAMHSQSSCATGQRLRMGYNIRLTPSWTTGPLEVNRQLSASDCLTSFGVSTTCPIGALTCWKLRPTCLRQTD